MLSGMWNVLSVLHTLHCHHHHYIMTFLELIILLLCVMAMSYFLWYWRLQFSLIADIVWLTHFCIVTIIIIISNSQNVSSYSISLMRFSEVPATSTVRMLKKLCLEDSFERQPTDVWCQWPSICSLLDTINNHNMLLVLMPLQPTLQQKHVVVLSVTASVPSCVRFGAIYISVALQEYCTDFEMKFAEFRNVWSFTDIRPICELHVLLFTLKVHHV